MKKIYLLLFTILIFQTTITYSQTTINFDDLSGTLLPIPDGYAGFTWTPMAWYLNGDNYGESGYQSGTTSSPNVAFTAYAEYPFGFKINGPADTTFTLTSMQMTAAWTYQSMYVVGKNNGVEIFRKEHIALITTAPLLVEFNWVEIDEVEIFVETYGEHLVIDDIIINGTNNLNKTPVCNPIDINLDENGTYKLDSLDMVEITGISPDSLKTFDDLMIYAYPDTFSCANIEWPVFVRITEYNGNYKKERCWAMVTVHDFTPPTISGTNIELSLDETGQAVLTPQMVTDSTLFDACGIDTISLDKSIFTCDDLGDNTVVLTATDLHGNIAADTILVTITDDQAPVVEPVTDLEIPVAPGVCWTTIEYPVPVINDNCTYTLTQTGGLGPDAQFPIGTTTESWIVTDAAGNSAEIEFNVIIIAGNGLPTVDTPSEVTEDEDTPEILIPITGISYGNDCKAQMVELTAVSDNNELISDIEVSYTDGESEAELKLTIAPDMNGTAKVTLTVKDEMEGMIYKTFNVTISPVNDAPVVVKPVADQIVNASYVLTIPVSSALGELFDDVDGDVLMLTAMMADGTPPPAWVELVGDELICSPMIEDTGDYTVVVKAVDPDGASATDTFVVVVDGYPVSAPLIDAGFDVTMYPNPTANRVKIELKNSGNRIDIAVFNITGSEVFRNTYYDTHLINLNMDDNGSGVYLVRINVDGKNVIKKLVVDKK